MRCLVFSNMTGICAFAMEEIGQGIFLSAGLFVWESEITNYEELVIKIERQGLGGYPALFVIY